MKKIIFLLLFVSIHAYGWAQSDSIQKPDRCIYIPPVLNFYAINENQDAFLFPKSTFNWQKMSTVSYLFHDSIAARRLIQNRYMPATKTILFYKDHPFYFDDPLQPYGRNDLPSVFIFGTLNYLFELFCE